MLTPALLATALLFRGRVLHSLGSAAFLLNALPPKVARQTIRGTFPHFHLFVSGVGGITDAGAKARFKCLNDLSLIVPRVLVGIAGIVPARFVGRTSA